MAIQLVFRNSFAPLELVEAEPELGPNRFAAQVASDPALPGSQAAAIKPPPHC